MNNNDAGSPLLLESKIKWSLVWSVTFASFAQLTAGSIYVFSLYGPQLSSVLGLSQSEISFVAAQGNNGMYLSGPFIGFFIDRYASKPHYFLLMGGMFLLTGYSLLSLTYLHFIPGHFLLLSLYNAFVGMGAASAYHSSLATNIRNFPIELRGLSVGVPVAAYGLSAFLFTSISPLFVVDQKLNVAAFLFMLGFTCFLLNVMSSIYLKDLRLDNKKEEESSSTSEENEALITQEESCDLHSASEHLDTEILMEPTDSVVNASEAPSIFTSPKAYILGLILLFQAGTGLMYINNVGAIIKALALEHDDAQKHQRFHVAFLSLASFSGRILCGFMSDIALKIGIKRLFWCFLSGLCICISSSLASQMTQLNHLYWTTGFMGLGYGMMWSSIPACVGDFFGILNFAKNWGFYQILASAGGQLTSFTFGWVYDSHKQGGTCLGVECFQTSFYVTTVFSVCSLICVFILKMLQEKAN